MNDSAEGEFTHLFGLDQWQGQKNRSDSKFFKNPDFCCQSNSRKCMKAVFLLLNRRLLRGSDRKNRGFFRFCCFCSLKKKKKQGVESVFAVKGENQGRGQGARYVAVSRRCTRGPGNVKGCWRRRGSKPEGTRRPRKNGPQGPVLQIVLKSVVRVDMPRRLRLPRQMHFRPWQWPVLIRV